MTHRIPIYRQDANGTVVDGTAALMQRSSGVELTDFRDLDGNELVRPPGSTYNAILPLPDGWDLRQPAVVHVGAQVKSRRRRGILSRLFGMN